VRKLVRDAITLVREAGGSNVWVSEGGRHTRVHFTTAAGRQTMLVIHRGNIVTTRFASSLRSRLRRKSEIGR
jgi:hypothetical protein